MNKFLWNQIFWERFKYCNTKVGDRWHFSTSAIDAGLQKSSSASRTTPKSCPQKEVKNWKKLVKMGCPAQDQLCTSPISQKNWVCLHFGGLLAAFFLLFFFFLSIEWVAKSKSGQLLIFAKYSHKSCSAVNFEVSETAQRMLKI